MNHRCRLGLGAGLLFSLTALAGHPARVAEETVMVSGDTFLFSPNGGGIAGAEITVLEHPELGAAIVDENGHWAMDGFTPGEEVNFIFEAPGYKRTQTGILTIGETGLEKVTLQVPSREMYAGLAAMLLTVPDPRRCQLVSTVTRKGASLYGPDPTHGEEGATVTIDPPVDPKAGPVYFNHVSDSVVVPDPRLEATTIDGGVLYMNVPPGEYVLSAHKDGVSFSQARVLCRAGLLVNASPPYGIQAQ